MVFLSNVNNLLEEGTKEQNQECYSSHKASMPMKVHSIIGGPVPDDNNATKKKDTVTENMENKIFQWSQHLFHCWYLTSHEVCQFELLAQFLYDIIQEDDIEYSAHLMWIDNVSVGSNSDVYAARLFLVVTCSKCIAMLYCIH